MDVIIRFLKPDEELRKALEAKRQAKQRLYETISELDQTLIRKAQQSGRSHGRRHDDT